MAERGGSATSSAPQARILFQSSSVRSMVDEMTTSPAHKHIEGLRPRHCCEPSCRAVFSVCASCDRGQRYCSEACRKQRRVVQVRAAGKRYQESESGRWTHCRRQQTYRERQSRTPVTHQAMAPVTSAVAPLRRPLIECAICGRSSPWINPFPAIPLRR